MNADVKAQWVKALRSGDYEQGKRALCVEGKYCCLGVLSDLAVKAGVIDEPIDLDNGELSFDGGTAFASDEVVEWSGLTDGGGSFRDENDALYSAIIDEASYQALYEANDKGVPFDKIADVIEEHF